MIDDVAEGALPMRLEEWNEKLSLGWIYDGKPTNAGHEGTLKEPSSRLQPYDPVHLGMESSSSIRLEDPETVETSDVIAKAKKTSLLFDAFDHSPLALLEMGSRSVVKLGDVKNVDAGPSQAGAQKIPSGLDPSEYPVPHQESPKYIKLSDIENVDARESSETDLQSSPSPTELYDLADAECEIS